MRTHISIIIPTLNEQKALPLLLDDLKKQTDKNFEVIIVDAKSKDLTRKKALSFNKQLSLTFIDSPKGNVAFQRNLGASNAQSGYLFFMDADTRLAANAIENLLMHIHKEKKQLYLPIIRPSNPTLVNRMLVNFSIRGVQFLQKIKTPLSIGPIIVIHKSLFNTIKGFDESIIIGEDHNIIIKSYRAGVTATFLHDVKCEFSMRRFDSVGTWHVVWQYAQFTTEILVKGSIGSRKKNYEMGGQRYLK